MNSKYFRRRKPFDFDPHPLDVGVPFSKNDTHADVHFLIKVQRLPESQLEDLFLRHFNYYKAEFNDTDGREFFKKGKKQITGKAVGDTEKKKRP